MSCRSYFFVVYLHQSNAVIYSLIEAAKENKLDLYRYLLWVLQTALGLSQTDENRAEKLLVSNAPQENHIRRPGHLAESPVY